MQTDLRQQAASARKLRVPGNINYWSARNLFEVLPDSRQWAPWYLFAAPDCSETDCLEWSPCSRWVALIQKVLWHWLIMVWDTLTLSQSCIQPDEHQQTVHMQWLEHYGWLLYLTGSASPRRTSRVLATSNVLTGEQHKTLVDAVHGVHSTQAIRRGMACGHDVVAWVLPEFTESNASRGSVALLQLPSLKQRAVLTGSLPSCNDLAPSHMWLSPNIALLEVEWSCPVRHACAARKSIGESAAGLHLP